MDLKMNWINTFLIKFLMIFSFLLKGAVAVEGAIYGVVGHPGFLHYHFENIPARVRWFKGSVYLGQILENKTKPVKDGYTLFLNGTLKINNLTKEDTGTNYKMEAYERNGTEIMKHIFTLVVQEFLQPKIIENCSTKIVSCEVMHNIPPMPNLVFISNNETLSNTERPFYINGKVRLNYMLKNHYGSFTCKASNNANTQYVEKQINCSDPIATMFSYLLIGGIIVVFIIIGAVILYCCIRKKRAKKRELEAEERELRTRIAVENGLKNRKLPQPPVRGASNQPPQPSQPNKPPPLHPEVPQQAGPPQPRPRPHQKPPRHMREKP